jgi:hypothetical protein
MRSRRKRYRDMCSRRASRKECAVLENLGRRKEVGRWKMFIGGRGKEYLSLTGGREGTPTPGIMVKSRSVG